MSVAVVGAGAWGTTLAAHLSRRAPTVLWAREPEVVDDVRSRRRNERFLPGFDLPTELRVTDDLAEAVAGAEAVVVAVPSQYLRSVAADLGAVLAPDVPVLSVVKGIEAGTLRRPTEVPVEVLGRDPATVGVLSGPNLAREVMAGHPSATVIAMTDPVWRERLQVLVSDDRFRAYTNQDVVGCEIGGAVKNVLAIAAGMADGMGYGWNTRAALTTRGLAELARLGVALGGEPLTFLGLAGNGDLVATCGSPDSRNHRVGQGLAAGRTVDDIVSTTASVAEGVRTAPSVLELAARVGVEMPICDRVAAVLRGERSPSDALGELMRREPQHELHGLDG
jgi:glycerol-3-phosphate dehydrogenase (NAD(P)+)